MIEDLENIGPLKPVGFVALQPALKLLGMTQQELVARLESRDLHVLTLNDSETMHFGGALYACHKETLDDLLRAKMDILIDSNWPLDSNGFMRKIANEWVEEKTPLFDLVADSFGDKTHPGRTDVPVPDHDARYQPQYLEMLRLKEQARKP